MHALLLPKQIPFHVVLAFGKHYVGALGVDVQIAILAAYRAVAVCHSLRVQRRGGNSVRDGSAVAVGFIPDFGRR